MTFTQTIAAWGIRVAHAEELMERLCKTIDLFEQAKTESARKAIDQAALCLMFVILSEIDP